MRGEHLVIIRNNRVQYKFTIRRNITVLREDSATGKTTLINMIADRENNGEDSGVQLTCDVPCVTLGGHDWESRLEHISGSIVFIDEGNAFVTSHDFARAVSRSDNYYVIAIRESLSSLPYSVDEIYGIRNDTRQKYQGIRRVYSSFKRIYSLAADFQ